MADSYALPTLTDGNLRLRQPRLDDVDARIAAGNHAEILRMYGVADAKSGPITQESASAWVRYHVEQEYSWFLDIDGKLSGLIFLHSFYPTDQRASLAMGLLRETDLGQGYGTRALRLVVAHAFEALNLHRIALRVLTYNARAIAAYEKVGFVIEGRQRQSAKVGDGWEDDLIMGLLAPDWQALA